MALKFVSHFEWIAIALNPPGADTPLWDEQDGFFYDVMRMPDGTTFPLKVRSLVGLLPLCAATVFDADMIDRHPVLMERARAFIEHFSGAVPSLAHLPGPGVEGRRLLALVDETQLRQILTSCWTSRSSSDSTASARSRGAISTSPAGSSGPASTTRSATCPPSPTPACSAATRTGAGRCGSR